MVLVQNPYCSALKVISVSNVDFRGCKTIAYGILCMNQQLFALAKQFLAPPSSWSDIVSVPVGFLSLSVVVHRLQLVERLPHPLHLWGLCLKIDFRASFICILE